MPNTTVLPGVSSQQQINSNLESKETSWSKKIAKWCGRAIKASANSLFKIGKFGVKATWKAAKVAYQGLETGVDRLAHKVKINHALPLPSITRFVGEKNSALSPKSTHMAEMTNSPKAFAMENYSKAEKVHGNNFTKIVDEVMESKFADKSNDMKEKIRTVLCCKLESLHTLMNESQRNRLEESHKELMIAKNQCISKGVSLDDSFEIPTKTETLDKEAEDAVKLGLLNTI